MPTGQLLTPSTKPKIKQPKAGSTDSMRQARVLRQRTASDSSQDGLSDARSVASIRGRSGSESGRSSRSSLEGGQGLGAGEEKVASGPPSSKDRSYSSISATSSPSTHHSEGEIIDSFFKDIFSMWSLAMKNFVITDFICILVCM